MIKIKLFDVNQSVLFEAQGTAIDAMYEGEFKAGDYYRISTDEVPFIWVQLDESLGEGLVLVPNGDFTYEIPFDRERKAGYAPGAFAGERHIVRVREATEEEAYGYRDLAFNPHDRHGAAKLYPHADANFVTREDPCFFERNRNAGND